MKNYKKITVASIASIALVATLAGGVSAADPTTTVVGGNVTGSDGLIRLTREISNVTNPVSNVYSYTVAAKAGNPGTATGFPTTATAEFNAAAVSGGKATATADFNFNNLSVSALGDYYFTVTETASSNASNFPVSNTTYDIVVSVLNDLNEYNVPNGNYKAYLAASVKDGADKTDFELSTAAVRTYISASASTTGEASDANECFRYKVNIPVKGSIAIAGDEYTITSTTTCTGNSEKAVVGGDNYINLKNGDTVTIGLNGSTNEMPIGADYTIQLTDKKGYDDPYFNNVQQSSLTTPVRQTVTVSDSNFSTANQTAIKLNKNGSVNTGVILNILPFVLMAIGAGAGVFAVVKTKQKENR